MRPAILAALLAGQLAVSCSGDIATMIDADEVQNYGDTPLEHTVYLGSDSRFHYFAWSSGKACGKWKVDKSRIPFRDEFELGSRGAFLVIAPDGTIQPHRPSN